MNINSLIHSLYSRLIKNKDVSIISNNCWGGIVSQYFNIKYNSPFVGLFVFAPDYIRLLKKLRVINDEIRFIPREQSKYYNRLSLTTHYPIGVIGDDIELHFLHYATADVAAEKWKRRVQRMDTSNMIVKFCDRDSCTPQLIAEFDRLPYKHKICFTAKAYPQYPSCCQIKEQCHCEMVHDYWTVSQKYWDVVKVANDIKGYPSSNAIQRAMLWIANRLVKYYQVKTV